MPDLNPAQFEHRLPAREIRAKFRPEPHELYSENTGRPEFHEDDAENLRQVRAYKLNQAQRPYWQDEPVGPDNKSLVEHIKSSGFPGSVLLDRSWGTVVDGNTRLEAAHHIDPDYPVPVTYKR